MKKNVFIDGEVGTTGLQVYDRLSKHPNVNILKVDQSNRKETSYKKEMLNFLYKINFSKYLIKW